MIRTILITRCGLLDAVPAHAMCNAEGTLPLPWALDRYAVAAPFVVLGIQGI